VALAEVKGPDAALRIIDALHLPQYHPLHAVRAHLLQRLGRNADAAAAYQTAIGCCSNPRAQEFLQRQYQSATAPFGIELNSHAK
jgi:RNA polymerase sigma-70 factor (ECF subfamily)